MLVLPRSDGHLIVGSTPQEGVPNGSLVQIPRGVPARGRPARHHHRQTHAPSRQGVRDLREDAQRLGPRRGSGRGDGERPGFDHRKQEPRDGKKCERRPIHPLAGCKRMKEQAITVPATYGAHRLNSPYGRPTRPRTTYGHNHERPAATSSGASRGVVPSGSGCVREQMAKGGIEDADSGGGPPSRLGTGEGDDEGDHQGRRGSMGRRAALGCQPGRPPSAQAVAASVPAVVSSLTPAFIPRGCGTGTPAYNYGGSGDGPIPRSSTGRHLLRVHDRRRPREPHRGAGLVVAQLGLRALHAVGARLLRLDSSAEPFALGTSEHPDVAGRLPVRRTLGHVLRRGPGGARVGHRVRLPHRGDRRLHLRYQRGVQRRLQRPYRVSIHRLHRPRAVCRPEHRRRLSRVETERRRLVGAGLHLGPATEHERHRVRRGFERQPPAHEQHRQLSLGGHGGGSLDEGGR